MSIVETEENFKENSFENQAEKEKVTMELRKIDKARDIVKKRYSYGVLGDFIDHLASTEKVFLLAGIKKFGGDEIMDMFINSETEVMSSETGIDEDVFAKIKEEFFKTCKTVSEIKNISNKLIEKYPEAENFLVYIEEYSIILLETSREVSESRVDINEEREKAIHEMMIKIAENDKSEIEELKKIYEEFKNELEMVGE